MKKEHWIILGVGAVALYIYMNNKKKTPVAAVTATTKEALVEEELSASGRTMRRARVQKAGATTKLNCKCDGRKVSCYYGVGMQNCEQCCDLHGRVGRR